MKTLIWAVVMALSLSSAADFIKEDVVRINFRDGRSEVFSLGGSGAHGGDFYEMKIHNFGWQVLELIKKGHLELDETVFEEKLTNLVVEIVEDVYLNDLSRQAVNIPENNKWYITKNTYQYITNINVSFQNRVQFFLHEFLPLMGQVDRGYRRSNEYTIAAFEEIESHGSELKEVIFMKNFSDSRRGADFESVEKLCERIKKRNKDKYFAVYCLYKEKRDYYHRGYYKEVYGLKVIGLGPVEKLEKKYIVRADNDDMPLYKTSSEALVSCYSIIATEDDIDFTYYKAKCELVTLDDGYKFNIVTLNPYVKQHGEENENDEF